ncbi:MAG: DUF541 domain-containing protein [Candidatus Liptonbacteria bacterium]|nr:DUF541 domain-containing protein [Candidatus Liptonbacteria bacterium]
MNENRLKNWFWLLLNIALACFIVGFVFVALPTMKRFGSSFITGRTITVAAEGKTLVAPDIAELSFSVVSQGKNPDELTESNNQKMNAVNKFVKGEGIGEKDMKTTSYTLVPNYQFNPTTQRNFITGYTLTQTLTIKVRELAKVAKIIAGLTPLGVNQVGGVSFMVEDEERPLAEARKNAFEKAQAKAEEMARASGVSLGKVVSVTEYVPGPIPYYAYGMGGAAEVKGAPAPTVPTIEPGTTEVKLNVQLIYELR